MSSLLPDQLEILSQTLQKDEIVIATTLQVAREDIREWLDGCASLVRQHASAMAGKLYTLALDTKLASKTSCSISHLLSAASSGATVLTLDLARNYLSSTLGSPTVSASLQRTKSTGGFEFLVHGTYIYLVLAGNILGERDLLDGEKLPPAGIAYYRRCSQLRELIRDHARQEIAREAGVKYWADKQKRILLSSPENTEKIFQRSLITWLRHFVVDQLRIVSETRGFGQDATDITVITGAGDYVVEVKWMGKNDAGTTYDWAQVSVGATQVALYLDRDDRLVTGTLVIYDGRASSGSGDTLPDKTSLHVRCELPEVVWLDSQTPSQIAASSAPPSPRRKKAQSAKEKK